MPKPVRLTPREREVLELIAKGKTSQQIGGTLEPIREVWIHDEAFAATRLSMMRIMARRTKEATVVA